MPRGPARQAISESVARAAAAVLPRAFYARPTLEAAFDLIGKVVVHVSPDGAAAGMVVEVEAYAGEDDPACHAASGLTRRNAPLYGPPGRAYVYLNYGLHHLLNAVTEPAGSPGAVLIRALEPRDGLALMRRRRAPGARAGSPAPSDDALCRGPGNLTAALGITLAQNGTRLGGRDAVHRGSGGADRAARLEPADRHPGGRRAALAVLRARLPFRLGAALMAWGWTTAFGAPRRTPLRGRHGACAPRGGAVSGLREAAPSARSAAGSGVRLWYDRRPFRRLPGRARAVGSPQRPPDRLRQDLLMDSIQATRLRRGMLIKLHDSLFRVLELQHVTPGNKRGFVTSKLRNVRAGTLTDHKFSSGEFVERAMLDARQMQFLYADGDGYHFMDTETYEQIRLDAETLGDSTNYLLPDATITVELFEGSPVGIGLPLTVDLTVEETAPAIKGATASAQLKPARLETGLVVQVPPFIANGDKVRVNTETGEYQARA